MCKYLHNYFYNNVLFLALFRVFLCNAIVFVISEIAKRHEKEGSPTSSYP
jgi:hypothetical protein